MINTNETQKEIVQRAIEYGKASLEDPRLETPNAQEYMKRVRTLNMNSKVGGSRLSAPWGYHEIGGQKLVWLGTGCPWYQAKEGGCTVCDGYGGHTDIEKTSPCRTANLRKAIAEALEFIKSDSEEVFRRGKKNYTINIGSAATFEDTTFPPELRRELYQGVNDIAKKWYENGRRAVWVCESRPEDLTAEKLKEMRQYVDSKVWTAIGIGLEATNNFVRNGLVNKGTSKDAAEKLGATIGLGYKNKVGLEVHAMLGIPGLNESEAMASAIQTSKDSLNQGAERVILMTGNIKRGASLATKLYETRLYDTPSMHATYEVLKTLSQEKNAEGKHPYANILPFGFAAFDDAEKFADANGCKEGCTDLYRRIFDGYAKKCLRRGIERAAEYLRRVDSRPGIKQKLYDCACRKSWDKKIEAEMNQPRLYDRLDGWLSRAEATLKPRDFSATTRDYTEIKQGESN